jgi:hypothetical protein
MTCLKLSAIIGKIAGYEGILCGASAVYAGLAQVLNEVKRGEKSRIIPNPELLAERRSQFCMDDISSNHHQSKR